MVRNTMLSVRKNNEEVRKNAAEKALKLIGATAVLTVTAFAASSVIRISSSLLEEPKTSSQKSNIFAK